MKKARKRIHNFAEWAFRKLGLKPIPVRISYKYDTVTCDGGVGFGAYCYDYATENKTGVKPGSQRIYAAGKMLRTEEMLRTVAHEIVHYKQMTVRGTLDFDDAEEAAEVWGCMLVEQYKSEVQNA